MNAYVADYKRELLEALIRERVSDWAQIERGLSRVRSDFLPNPNEFAQSCRVQPEDLGLPSLDESFHQAVTRNTSKHPAVIFALRQTDSWALQRMPEADARKVWAKLWGKTVEHVIAGGELPQPMVQIEDMPRPKASRETAMAAMGSLRGMFA